METSQELLSVITSFIDSQNTSFGPQQCEDYILAIKKCVNSITEMPSPNVEVSSLIKASYLLWNNVVTIMAMKEGNILNILKSGSRQARLRHLACDILLAVQNFDNQKEQDFEFYNTLVRFTAKTGQIWAEEKNYVLSDELWETGLEVMSHVEKNLNLPKDALEELKLGVFNLLNWRLESAIFRKLSFPLIFPIAEQARDITSNSSQASFLLSFSYNQAVSSHEKRDFEEARQWLDMNLGILESFPSMTKHKEKKGRSLRLLTSCYIGLNEMNKAFSCAELALFEVPHVAGFYMMASVCLQLESKRHMFPEVFEKLLAQDDCTFDVAASVLKEAVALKLHQESLVGYELLTQKFLLQPAVLEKILKFECILASDENAAEQYLKDMISDYHREIFKLSNLAVQQITFLVWNCATSHYNKKDFLSAIIWFKHALSFILPHDVENKAHCTCLIAQCYLFRNEIETALEFAEMSRITDPNLLPTNFILYKIYLEQNKEMDVLNVLNKLSKSQDCLEQCAQIAFQKNKPKIAIQALECLLSVMTNDLQNIKLGEISKVLRTLIKLCLQGHEPEIPPGSDQNLVIIRAVKLVMKLNSAPNFLEIVFDNDLNEVDWLSSVLWNIGVKAVESNNTDLSESSLEICAKLLKYLPQSEITFEMRMKCLAFLSGLLLNRAAGHEDYEQTRKYIEECKDIRKTLLKLKQTNDVDSMILDDNHHSSLEESLIVMEFEAKFHLDSQNLPATLKQIESSKITGSKKAEILLRCATLMSKETNMKPQHRKMILDLFQSSQALFYSSGDYSKSAEITRKLIKFSTSRNESKAHYENVVNQLKQLKTQDNVSYYPSQELQWLFITAYSMIVFKKFCYNGIFYCRVRNFSEAEMWLALSLSLLNYYEHKDNYESQILEIYNSTLKFKKPSISTTLSQYDRVF